MKLEEFERILGSYGERYAKFKPDNCSYCCYKYSSVNWDLTISAWSIVRCPIREYIDKIFNRWLEAEETIYK